MVRQAADVSPFVDTQLGTWLNSVQCVRYLSCGRTLNVLILRRCGERSYANVSRALSRNMRTHSVANRRRMRAQVKEREAMRE
jgi:hypothetical protein